MHALWLATIDHWRDIQGAVIGLIAIVVLASGLALDARSERADDE